MASAVGLGGRCSRWPASRCSQPLCTPGVSRAMGWATATTPPRSRAGLSAGRLSSSVLRSWVVHHRRQAAGVPVGAGALRPCLWILELEHPAAPGIGWSGLGSDPVPVGETLDGRDRRAPGGAGPVPHPRGRRDVPVQQSRCLSHPLSPGRGLGVLVGARTELGVEAGARRWIHRLGLYREDARSLRSASGFRARLSSLWATQTRPPHSPGARWPAGPCHLQ